ncbi:MAG: transglutaminase-like domain-containing protein, partial [Chloroflexi bacterium]|nr:transglutaminase-like domain-containing protein [Chloroflexota bacterium]
MTAEHHGQMNSDAMEHLSIDAELDTRACYALSVNRRPPIRSVNVRNLDGVYSGTLTISVTSEWAAAERPPIRQVVQAIDCPVVGGSVEVDFSTSRLDDIALAYLDDKTNADIIVTVRDSEGHEQSRRFEILVLARNQWIAALQDITAAFIQADHPTIADIRGAAAKLLAQRTGSNSLEGYQSGPERAVQIAEAIYDALGDRITTYLDVPPSEFESDTEGQRVRPLDQLLETGQGNCIELACAFAACAHSAGIQPVVFIVHGHAF